MMKRNILVLLRTFLFAAFVPALSLSLVSCEPENGGGNEGGGTVTPSVTPEVSVPDGYVNYFIEDLSFSRSAGEVKVAFQINVEWSMAVVAPEGVDASWLSVEPASGSVGLHKVMVRVTDNDTYELRSAKIHLLCGTVKVAEIAVTQDYDNAVLLSRSDYSVSFEATTIDVELKSNVDFEYKVLDADWVRASTNATRSWATHNLTFDVDENDSRKEREAHILFYCSEYAVADTLTLVQEDNPNIVPEFSVPDGCVNYFTSPLQFSSSTDEARVIFQIDEAWTMEVVVPEGVDASWLSVESASGFAGLHEVKVRVTGHDAYESRSATVCLMSGGFKMGEVAVTQSGKYKPEAVDLGLSIKWASCNIGAESPEEYGDYFAWGETTTKLRYTESNSVTYGLSISELESRGIIGSDGNLTAEYDAATANWGSPWRMPTLAEIKELIDECTWEWTSVNGVKGRLVTGPNGNSIFLPAAGFRLGTSLYGAGDSGYYWSATPGSGSYLACYLDFDSVSFDWGYDSRYDGRALRPVSE